MSQEGGADQYCRTNPWWFSDNLFSFATCPNIGRFTPTGIRGTDAPRLVQPGPQGQHRLQNRQIPRSRNGEVPVEGGGLS